MHFLNGRLVPEAELLISPRDLGFARGYAVFDFTRTYRRVPFKLAEHVARLLRSAAAIDLAVPWSGAQIEAWVLETIAANPDLPELFVRIMLSGGPSSGLVPAGNPTIVILADPAVVYPAELYERGAAVTTAKFDRYLPQAKTNNYIEGVRQAQLAAKVDATETVYYSDAQVYEGSTSNVFAVIDGALVTPASSILKGCTREVLLEILKLDVPVEERDFTIEELRGAAEVFIAASGKEIVPIVTIDGAAVAGGEAGPVTREAMRQFRAYTDSDLWVPRG